jgi:hypothetical protein
MAAEPSTAVIPIRRVAVAPWENFTYADAQRELTAIQHALFTIRKQYVIDQDHYNKGREWVGPGQALSTGKIADQFAPEDAIGEVVKNVSNAFSEPQLGVSPIVPLKEGEQLETTTQDRMKQCLDILTDFWDRNNLQELIQDRQEMTAAFGVAGLGLWIPWRFLNRQADGRITLRAADNVEDAARMIAVRAPLPDSAGIIVDPGTMDICAVFLDKEVIYDNQGHKHEFPRAELVFLDPNRNNDHEAMTIIRHVYSDPRRGTKRSAFPLGGHLLFEEMKAQSLLSDPVIRTQRQLNLLCTLITRIGETAAFRERYIVNAKPQGLRMVYEEGDDIPSGAFLEDRDEEGRQWLVIPQERTLGAATTNELVGLPNIDPNTGDTRGYVTPSVTIVDPVDPSPYLLAIDAVRRRILRMCSQGHLGGASNAEASGIAYEQARAVFEKDLNRRRVAEEGMLRYILTAFLHMVELITDQPGYFTSILRVTVDQNVNAGPRSPDLVRLDLEAYEAGVLSWETAADRVGVEDVEAERIRVRRSAAFILDILEKATASSTAFTPESLIEVMKQLNLPLALVEALEAKEEPAPPTGAQVPPTGATE